MIYPFCEYPNHHTADGDRFTAPMPRGGQWLAAYLDKQGQNQLHLTRNLTMHRLNLRKAAIAQKSLQRWQRDNALVEIATDEDMRWTKSFMPREFA